METIGRMLGFRRGGFGGEGCGEEGICLWVGS